MHKVFNSFPYYSHFHESFIFKILECSLKKRFFSVIIFPILSIFVIVFPIFGRKQLNAETASDTQPGFWGKNVLVNH